VIALAVAIPLSAAGSQHNALMVRNMRWIRMQAVPTVAQIAGLCLAVLSILLLHLGYWALVVQQVSVALFTLIMNWTLCRWRPSLPVKLADAKDAISFGGYLTGSNIINYFYGQADNALIGWRWGSVELGYYARAYQLLTLPINLINQSASSVALPALARLQSDVKAWNSGYLQLSTVTSMGGVGLCAILFAAAEPIVLIAMGPKWHEVIPIFRLLSISSVLATSSNSCSWVFMSTGRTKSLLYWSMFATPLFLASYVIGLPWGARGVAAAYAAAMMVLAPFYFVYALRHTSLALLDLVKAQGPIYLAAFLSGAGGYFAAEAVGGTNLILLLIVSAGIAALVYGGLCLLFVWMLPQYARIRALLLEQTNYAFRRLFPFR
jgi:PST family polysaccharide transporter